MKKRTERRSGCSAVVTTSHDMPKAALPRETPEAIHTQFESLLERLQTPVARKGMEAAFNASPRALGRAAVKVVRRRQ